MRYVLIGILALLCLYPSVSFSQKEQRAAGETISCPAKIFSKISDKASAMNDRITRRTEKYLRRLEEYEKELYKKVQRLDPEKAKGMFAGTGDKYAALSQSLQADSAPAAPTNSEYLPSMDSLQTGLSFLGQHPQLLASSTDKDALQSSITQLQILQGKYQQTSDIQKFCRERERTLKEQLARYGLGKQLLKINQENFYYQQQLEQYKNIWNDKEKLEQTVMGTIRKLPEFQSFMQKNSYLSRLFPMPENLGTLQALAGLQTRTEIQSILQRAASGLGQGSSSGGNVQQQVQQAQNSLNQLKDKVGKLGGNGGSGNMTMPDFTPNSQRTRKFLQRVEWGFNMQNAQSTRLLPVTTDIALTIGYRVSDKITPGISVGYKLGWGNDLGHIRFSSQGVDLRSYLDIKAKGSIWITGGFEYSYLQEFSKISALRKLDVWQKSALLGLTKKYRVGKRGGNMQLLYDFLANYQTPRPSSLKFRIGFTF